MIVNQIAKNFLTKQASSSQNEGYLGAFPQFAIFHEKKI